MESRTGLSLNVGLWIRGQSRNYKPKFCISSCRRNSRGLNPDQWRYVPTNQNPVYKATRGLTAHELVVDVVGAGF